MTSRRSAVPKLAAAVIAGLAVAAASACGSSGSAKAAPGESLIAAASGIRTLSPALASAALTGGRVVLDVRTTDEYDGGHLAGARVLDFYQPTFAADLGNLDKNTPYLIYRHSGYRSGKARQLMEQLGFTDVVEVKGGITAWTADGLPVEK